MATDRPGQDCAQAGPEPGDDRGPKNAENRVDSASPTSAPSTRDLYAAQDTAWQEEIWRIFHGDDPDRIGPLKEEGIIDILEEDGPAPFLTNTYFADR